VNFDNPVLKTCQDLIRQVRGSRRDNARQREHALDGKVAHAPYVVLGLQSRAGEERGDGSNQSKLVHVFLQGESSP
jgi:hypothetical protein